MSTNFGLDGPRRSRAIAVIAMAVQMIACGPPATNRAPPPPTGVEAESAPTPASTSSEPARGAPAATLERSRSLKVWISVAPPYEPCKEGHPQMTNGMWRADGVSLQIAIIDSNGAVASRELLRFGGRDDEWDRINEQGADRPECDPTDPDEGSCDEPRPDNDAPCEADPIRHTTLAVPLSRLSPGDYEVQVRRPSPARMQVRVVPDKFRLVE